jgi:hypothetical protein
MHLVDRYAYRKMDRVTRPDGVRHYVCPDTGQPLVSVTTVLDATADKTWLVNWIKRVGRVKAEDITAEAAAIGSLMHLHLDQYALGLPRSRGNPYVRVMAEQMSNTIIEQGLRHVGEIWGSEVMLHVPGLYAGTTDLVGMYQGVPAVIDFKSARKMKTRDCAKMQDYFCQAGAYALSHDLTYDTDIRTAVIFMVDKTLKFETFIIEGEELKFYQRQFISRVETYRQRAVCASKQL